MLADANFAGADVLQRGGKTLVLRQLVGIRTADQNAFDRDFVDRSGDEAARVLDFYPEAARQPLLLVAPLAVALAQQHGAARFELLRKCRDGLAGLGDAIAMCLGFLGGDVDLGGAVADRDNEARRG